MVRIDGKTKLLGVVGFPLGHSCSPALHNAAIRHYGLDLAYVPLEVRPQGLRSLLETLPHSGFLGVNVTVPYKQTVLPCCDEISDTVRRLDAVNTITVRDGRLVGDNTDKEGFARSWREEGAPDVAGRQVIIVGAGGGARAVVAALSAMRASGVTVFNRSVERVIELAEWAHRELPGIGMRVHALEDDEALAQEIASACALVNTTSSGMWPDVDASPLRLPPTLPADFFLYDIVYNPPVTALMQQAIEAGARAAGGTGMLVHQGALSFEGWTGRKAPVEQMRAAVLELIAGSR